MNTEGIVLLAKTSGYTSFKALNSIKKALNTTKVGHTGTLDSFAQGLLVVCSGRLTRLAGNITEFDKSYKAVIKFGEETDTLEYTGKIIKTAPLPTENALKEALLNFTGNIMQKPPMFSAIHLDGKRASDIARKGKEIDLPARPVTVYSSKIESIVTSNEGLVEYALIDFSVSKGTYIRSLARDIGNFCGSAAHLIGLYRTKVGNFKIEDAAGYNQLEEFSINNSIKAKEDYLKNAMLNSNEHKKFVVTKEELELQEEIRQKIKEVDIETALLCGFSSINLISQIAFEDFKNGKPLRSKNFNVDLHDLESNKIFAVFSPEKKFAGLIEKDQTGKIKYKFVIN